MPFSKPTPASHQANPTSSDAAAYSTCAAPKATRVCAATGHGNPLTISEFARNKPEPLAHAPGVDRTSSDTLNEQQNGRNARISVHRLALDPKDTRKVHGFHTPLASLRHQDAISGGFDTKVMLNCAPQKGALATTFGAPGFANPAVCIPQPGTHPDPLRCCAGHDERQTGAPSHHRRRLSPRARQ